MLDIRAKVKLKNPGSSAKSGFFSEDGHPGGLGAALWSSRRLTHMASRLEKGGRQQIQTMPHFSAIDGDRGFLLIGIRREGRGLPVASLATFLMKILLSAFACNPVTGSDAHFGWSAAQAFSQVGDLHVLTHGFSRKYISSADESALKGVKFHFLGAPADERNRHAFVARLLSWRGSMAWHRRLALPYAASLHKREKFDVAHHVTLSSWRLPSPLWRLGIPLVWGPLGGGEEIPGNFLATLSPATRAFELFRRLTSWWAGFSQDLRACARNATISLAANSETAVLLQKLGATRVEVLSPAFFSDEAITRLTSRLPEKTYSGALEIFAGGSLEGRKGVYLALHALAGLKKDGLRLRYRLGGHGAEGNSLRRLAQELGLGPDEVVFSPGYTGSDYENVLHAAHIYLLPSLRENAGLTMMEAMLSGAVPVVAKLGGPGEIVTAQSGFALPPSDPASLIGQIKAAIRVLDGQRDLCQTLGRAASRRIASAYSAQAYLNAIRRIHSGLNLR